MPEAKDHKLGPIVPALPFLLGEVALPQLPAVLLLAQSASLRRQALPLFRVLWRSGYTAYNRAHTASSRWNEAPEVEESLSDSKPWQAKVEQRPQNQGPDMHAPTLNVQVPNYKVSTRNQKFRFLRWKP